VDITIRQFTHKSRTEIEHYIKGLVRSSHPLQETMEMHLNVFDPKRRPVDVEGLMKWARIGVPARTFAGLCTSSTEVVSAHVLATQQEFTNAGVCGGSRNVPG